jgi:membrane-anchored mycosin MYCP
MQMDEIERDRVQEYVADEFVVGTPYRDLVLRRLGDSRAKIKAQDADLGLTLVKLIDVAEAARHVRAERERAERERAEREPTGAQPTTRHGAADDRLRLGRLLADLRAGFAHDFGGWMPAMGKNRVMRGVQLFPYPSAGGDDDPAPLPRDTQLPQYTTNGRAGHGARLCVLDTAVYANDRLAGTYIAAPDSLLRDSTEVRDWWAGHATFVTGLIVQRAPAAQVEVESVLDVDGGATDVWEVARRLVRCADTGADVVNLSFGCFTVDGEPPLVLERAVARLTPDTVVVAASGNYGRLTGEEPPTSSTPIWPAAFENVVAVGATDDSGQLARFTPTVPWLDLLAPGVNVESTYLKGRVLGPPDKTPEHRRYEQEFTGLARWSGTSFAAATVSGAIAAGVVPGRRTAYEVLEQLRTGAARDGGTGIEVAKLPVH